MGGTKVKIHLRVIFRITEENLIQVFAETSGLKNQNKNFVNLSSRSNKPQEKLWVGVKKGIHIPFFSKSHQAVAL